jgi:hypothetical protein
MKLLQEFEEQLFLAELAAPTKFTGLQVLQNIIGADSVNTKKEDLKDGQYLVKNVDPSSKWDEPGFSKPFTMQFSKDDPVINSPGAITLYDYNSRDAKDIAVAAHEAYHALMYKKGKSYFDNEKLTNNLATKWLKKNLSGVQLHVALEFILKSNISYGTN